ncbi:MAG TPA: hypothetical protein VN033_05925, partial [Vulgatibacter sp.]|nr:hypothetical protein [Vulgatibacter sp.]
MLKAFSRLALALLTVGLVAACGSDDPKPDEPKGGAPTASLSVSSDSIQPGESVTLTWTTE